MATDDKTCALTFSCTIELPFPPPEDIEELRRFFDEVVDRAITDRWRLCRDRDGYSLETNINDVASVTTTRRAP